MSHKRSKRSRGSNELTGVQRVLTKNFGVKNIFFRAKISLVFCELFFFYIPKVLIITLKYMLELYMGYSKWNNEPI